MIYDHNQSIRLLINMHLKTRILINFAHVNLLNQQNHHFYAMFTIPKFGRFMAATVYHIMTRHYYILGVVFQGSGLDVLEARIAAV